MIDSPRLLADLTTLLAQLEADLRAQLDARDWQKLCRRGGVARARLSAGAHPGRLAEEPPPGGGGAMSAGGGRPHRSGLAGAGDRGVLCAISCVEVL